MRRLLTCPKIINILKTYPEKFPTPEAQQQKRERLFELIGKNLPAVFDPLAGGGSIPLEAQRLGLKAFTADLNPVAVMINISLG